MRHKEFERFIMAFIYLFVLPLGAACAREAPIVRTAIRAIGSVPAR